MKLIAITGEICSGKSSVLNLFKKYKGTKTLRADEIAKDIIKKNYLIIQKIVGKRIKYGDTIRNGPILSAIIEDISVYNNLNDYIWSCLWTKILEEKAKNFCDFLIVEVPVLFNTIYEGSFDYVIGVTCLDNTVHKRLSERPDHHRQLWNRNRIDQNDFLTSDFIVNTDHDRQQNVEKVKEIYNKISGKEPCGKKKFLSALTKSGAISYDDIQRFLERR